MRFQVYLEIVGFESNNAKNIPPRQALQRFESLSVHFPAFHNDDRRWGVRNVGSPAGPTLLRNGEWFGTVVTAIAVGGDPGTAVRTVGPVDPADIVVSVPRRDDEFDGDPEQEE